MLYFLKKSAHLCLYDPALMAREESLHKAVNATGPSSSTLMIMGHKQKKMLPWVNTASTVVREILVDRLIQPYEPIISSSSATVQRLLYNCPFQSTLAHINSEAM